MKIAISNATATPPVLNHLDNLLHSPSTQVVPHLLCQNPDFPPRNMPIISTLIKGRTSEQEALLFLSLLLYHAAGHTVTGISCRIGFHVIRLSMNHQG